MTQLPEIYESPSAVQVGGKHEQPMSILIAFFYVLGAVVWDGAAVVNYVAIVNAAAIALVAVKVKAIT